MIYYPPQSRLDHGQRPAWLAVSCDPRRPGARGFRTTSQLPGLGIYHCRLGTCVGTVQKRKLYERLAVHFRKLASDIEKVMAESMK